MIELKHNNHTHWQVALIAKTQTKTCQRVWVPQIHKKNGQHTTRNIRKPGVVGNFNFCTFTKNCNGLISWSFEIPASAYCHPLAATLTKR
jgi:hypothetical protein